MLHALSYHQEQFDTHILSIRMNSYQPQSPCPHSLYIIICDALRLLLCLIFLLVPWGEAWGQKSGLDSIVLHELTPKSFLSTTNIGIIMQDRQGYMWYGTTDEGLCRDDGYTVTSFSRKTLGRNVMDNDEVSCMCEDREGKIWFGTRIGLYVLDKDHKTIRRIKHVGIERRKVNCILPYGNHIWVGAGRSLILFDSKGKPQASYSIGTDTQQEVKELSVDSQGTLWVTVLRGGIFTIGKGEKELTPMPWNIDAAASYVLEDPSHRFYWVGTWGKGVVKYYKDGRTELQSMPEGSHLFCKEVNNMIIDSARHLMWVSTMDDLYLYSMENGRLAMMDTHTFLPQEKKLIGKISTDRKGNIWVPASSPQSFVIEWGTGGVRRDDVSAMSQEMGYKVMVDRVVKEGDYYWIYQRRTRLSLYNSRTGQLTFMATDAHPTPLTTQKVLSRCKEKAGVWTCSARRLIHVWHEDMAVYWEEDTCGIMPTYIASLNDLGNGRLLIGTDRRIFEYDYHHGKVKQLSDSVGVVHQVEWKNGQLEYSTTPNSFPRLTDSHGHIYTLTETTLTESNPKTGAARIINAQDNNVQVDCFTHLSISNDTICLGGIGAFCTLTPCLALDNSNPDQQIVMADSTHVTSLNHLHAQQVRYAYRFIPQNGLWRDTTDWRVMKAGENEVNFDSLDSGNYAMEVKCTDEFGRWSKARILTSVSLSGPWYMKWHTLLAAVLSIIIARIIIKQRRRSNSSTEQHLPVQMAMPTTEHNAQSAMTATTEAATKAQDAASVETQPSMSTLQAAAADKEAKIFMKNLTGLIKQHLDDQSYDNDRLAADMGMSRSNLYRRFQRHSSFDSLSTYIRSVRLEEGRHLLLTTLLSISDISYRVGFGSSQYFAKCFKEAYGMSPSECRTGKGNPNQDSHKGS